MEGFYFLNINIYILSVFTQFQCMIKKYKIYQLIKGDTLSNNTRKVPFYFLWSLKLKINNSVKKTIKHNKKGLQDLFKFFSMS